MEFNYTERRHSVQGMLFFSFDKQKRTVELVPGHCPS